MKVFCRQCLNMEIISAVHVFRVSPFAARMGTILCDKTYHIDAATANGFGSKAANETKPFFHKLIYYALIPCVANTSKKL